jgi:hypothetical protein
MAINFTGGSLLILPKPQPLDFFRNRGGSAAPRRFHLHSRRDLFKLSESIAVVARYTITYE